MNERYHGLDFSRAVLMTLGIFYHAGLIYSDTAIWEVAYSRQTHLFSVMTQFTHFFRMEAFYMIAGFFFMLVINKRGIQTSVQERVVKIAVPMLFTGFTLNYVMNAFSDRGLSPFSAEYYLGGYWMYHVWFLGNLLLYYFICAPLAGWCNKVADRIGPAALVAAVVTPVSAALLEMLAKQYLPERALFISFHKLFAYLPFFAVGMFYWRYRQQMTALFTLKNAALMFVVFAILKMGISPHIKDFSLLLHTLVYKTSYFFLALWSIFFLSWLGRKPNAYIQKVTDSSYSMYLIHQPFLIVFFVLVLSKLNLNPYLSFTILTGLTFVFCVEFHSRVINHNKVLLYLTNGKKPRKKKAFRSAEATS